MATDPSISQRALAAFGPGATAHDAEVLEAIARGIEPWLKAIER